MHTVRTLCTNQLPKRAIAIELRGVVISPPSSFSLTHAFPPMPTLLMFVRALLSHDSETTITPLSRAAILSLPRVHHGRSVLGHFISSYVVSRHLFSSAHCDSPIYFAGRPCIPPDLYTLPPQTRPTATKIRDRRLSHHSSRSSKPCHVLLQTSV